MSLSIANAVLSDKYILERPLGEGGMGEVFLAQERRSGRQVAIKFLKSGLEQQTQPEQQAHFVQRFRQEAQALLRLNHPNIVGVYDFGSDGDQHYIIMEYIEGRPLNQLISDFPRVPVSLCVAMGAQICSALAYMHQQGVIHRDIKPANIILARNGAAKLTDFGVVRRSHASGGLSQLEDNQSNLGTLKYSAPEQILDAREVGPGSDIYALGVTLFELLTDEHPFEADSVAAFISKVFESSPPSLRNIYWDIPEALEKIVIKAMARQPEDRYASAADMAEDLSALVDHAGLQKVLSGPMFRLSEDRAGGALQPVQHIEHTDLRQDAESRNQLMALRHNLGWLKALCADLPFKESESLPKSRFLERVVMSGFSGIIQINHDLFALVQNGYFLDFVSHSITERIAKTGDDLFHIIPDTLEHVRLHLVSKEQLYLPLLLANLLNERGVSTAGTVPGKAIRELLQSQQQLTGLLLCKNSDTLYCQGFSQGQQVVCLELNAVTAALSQADCEQILDRSYSHWDLYHAEVLLSPLNEQVLLRRAQVELRFSEYGPSLKNLAEATAAGELLSRPDQLALKTNLDCQLHFDLQKPEEVLILNTPVNAAELASRSVMMQALHYLCSEWMLEIHKHRAEKLFGNLFSGILQLTQGLFYRSYTLPEGENIQLDFCGLARTTDEVICTLRFGDGDAESLQRYQEDLKRLQQTHPHFSQLQAAFFISTGPLTPDALSTLETLASDRRYDLSVLSYHQHDRYFEQVRPNWHV